MSELEEKLNQVLGDPKAMEQLMAMARSLVPESQTHEPQQPGIDPGMVRKLAALAGSTGVDPNQRALLQALGPYISRERSAKLERAMRAARLATAASGFLRR